MKFTFLAKIYKVGINPCVKVPKRITDNLIANRGYVPVIGEINGHRFKQNLVPVKDAPYRLYVNGPMLKGSNHKVGDKARFAIEQDPAPYKRRPRMLPMFRLALEEANLMTTFRKLIPSRQKEVLLYMSFLKTAESRERNIKKVLTELRAISGN